MTYNEELIVVCTCTVCGEAFSYPYEDEKLTLCPDHHGPPPLSQDIIDRVHVIPVAKLKEMG